MNIKKFSGTSGLVLLAAGSLSAAQNTALPASPDLARDHSQTTSTRMESGHAVRGSQVLGSTVQSSDGKSLGQIRDLVIDPQSGRIDFAVLSLSGGDISTSSPSSLTSPSATSPTIASPSTTPRSTIPPADSSAAPSTSRSTIPGGPGESSLSYNASVNGRLVPVPWQLFGQNFTAASAYGSSSSAPGHGIAGGTMNLTLNVDEAKLRSAPSFEGNNWSALQQNGFGQRSYAYYGLDWNNRMGATGTAGPGVSSGIGTSSSDRRRDYDSKPRSPSDSSPDKLQNSPTTPPQAK